MHQEFLKELEHLNHEELPEEKPSKIKKIILWSIAITLVLLMVSFIFVTFPLGDILQGKVESNLLKGKIIDLDNFKIIFENGTEEELKSYYFNEQEVEISLCLEGYKADQDYRITSLYQPQTYQAAYNQVSFEPCSEETVIILHTHPYKRCIASETDLEMLKNSQKNNPEALMVVMCEAERFSVYE